MLNWFSVRQSCPSGQYFPVAYIDSIWVEIAASSSRFSSSFGATKGRVSFSSWSFRVIFESRVFSPCKEASRPNFPVQDNKLLKDSAASFSVSSVTKFACIQLALEDFSISLDRRFSACLTNSVESGKFEEYWQETEVSMANTIARPNKGCLWKLYV